MEHLKLLNQRPIAYYPIYKQIGGSTTAGLLLSQLMYWFSKKDKFFKTDEEIKTETLLTKKELETAKKRIKRLSFISITREGVPAKTYYKIDWNKYNEELIRIANENALNSDVEASPGYNSTVSPNCTNLDSSKGGNSIHPKRGNCSHQKGSSTTKTTTKTTTNIKKNIKKKEISPAEQVVANETINSISQESLDEHLIEDNNLNYSLVDKNKKLNTISPKTSDEVKSKSNRLEEKEKPTKEKEAPASNTSKGAATRQDIMKYIVSVIKFLKKEDPGLVTKEMQYRSVLESLISTYGLKEVKEVLGFMYRDNFWSSHIYDPLAIKRNYSKVRKLYLEKKKEKAVKKAKINNSTISRLKSMI